MKLTFIFIAIFINFFHFPFTKAEKKVDSSNNSEENGLKEDILLNRESEEKMIHIVKLGDTITSISRLYLIKKEEIMQLNNLIDEDYIYVGQILKISHKNEIQGDKYEKKIIDENYHIVQKGDNLTEISNKYGITLKNLIEMNDLKSSDSIKVGSRILLTKNDKNPITNFESKTYKNINQSINFLGKNYGPLTVEQNEFKKVGGRKTLNVKNQNNKKLIISINCGTKEIDVRIPGRKWIGWLPAEEEFEKNLIEDSCRNFD